MIAALYDVFQHWADGGSVYIISDTHFDDSDCALMDQNWPSPMELVKRINSVIRGKQSCLIHLGDVGDPSYIKYIKSRQKVLITGNHDAGASKYSDYFSEIYTGPLIVGQKLILSHEPVYVPWAFNIHGHDHNPGNLGDEMHLNMCSNVAGFMPCNLGELVKGGLLKNVTSIHRITIDKAAIDKSIKSGNIDVR